jgi:hypothetical protein
LSIILGVGIDVCAFVNKAVVGVAIIVKEVQMSRIVEAAVTGIAEVNYPAFLYSTVGVNDIHTLITKFAVIHAANTV